LAVWLWTKRQTWGRHVLLGLGWFSINLIPVLGFVRMSYHRVSWVADHLVYLPLVGLVGLAVAAAGAVIDRLSPATRPFALGACLVVCACLTVVSHRYAANFQDQETLWTYTLSQNPAAWLAENDLGYALEQKGRFKEALLHYQNALRLKPGSALVNFSFGNLLARSNRLAEAIDHYEQAVRLRPDYAEAHDNLGNALCQAGNAREAIGHFEAAIRLKRDYWAAYNNLGTALARTGRIPEAIEKFREALRLNPDSADIRANLDRALFISAQRVQAAPPAQ
jgi:tetratricopeptide (TPR) repeat protein